MQIELENIGKRYRFEWIFRNITTDLVQGSRLAIVGPNGSGKSTLMKILAGYLSPSKGKVNFYFDAQSVAKDQVFEYLTFAAPYMELIEEMSLTELVKFHQKFKPFQDNMDTSRIISRLGLEKSKNKQIRFFSSGMKQRVKLALAICSKASLMLLDEPSTNLDQQGMDWYQALIQDFAFDKTIVVASNVAADYAFCTERLSILEYKKK